MDSEQSHINDVSTTTKHMLQYHLHAIFVTHPSLQCVDSVISPCCRVLVGKLLEPCNSTFSIVPGLGF